MMAVRSSLVLDTDEASIDTCLSGLGVGQASPDFVEGELRSGQLVALCPEVIADVGSYRFVRPPTTPMAATFHAWLAGMRF